MSFFKDLLDSVSSFLSAPADRAPQMTSRPTEAAPAIAASSVVRERAVLKLKGYFELAKEEIDKALRAEEWGLAEDAVAHYRNAQRVMLEAKAVRVPDALPSREQNQVKIFQEKISKWQRQVGERIQILANRAGQTSKEVRASLLRFMELLGMTLYILTKKDLNLHLSCGNISSHALGRLVPYSPKTKQNFPQFKYSHKTAVSKKKDTGGQKPLQEAGSTHDVRLVEMINTAIVDKSPAVKWDDVAGIDKAKQTLMEMVILPTKRRDLFTGLRKPAKGLLLFGPPGNGKTMLAKAVASESEATFFNVSASSLTSKWVGEAEKLVRTLFMIAVAKQPSVIFIDEIDSVLSTRIANENDASRRLKSEFLIQFDGVTSNQNDLVIVIGATNKPQELDDAVLRRLVKRIYVPLPDENVRKLLLKNRLKGQAYALPSRDVERLAKETDGYSGSDLQALCEEAAMAPIRELGPRILTVKSNQVRPLRYEDFRKAMAVIRPSLQRDKWEELERWNAQFGSN